MEKQYILTLSCRDVRGIVAAVSGFLADHQGFVIESAQFGDATTGRFFMRVDFTLDADDKGHDAFAPAFEKEVAKPFAMEWQLHDKHIKTRTLVMVSKEGHCLNDLLYRHATGQLPIDIAAIVSNHPDWKKVASWHEIPFYHLPIEGDKAGQEAQLLDIIDQQDIGLVVLARYMQILSANLCGKLAGRAINIHHSFLPGFKGASPYKQAFDRGVKLIGATAHFVTTDLDEGPIIEQEVTRVDHSHSVADMVAIGRDTECMVLSRAVKYYAEHRVLLGGDKTVVFR
ncbi:MAG: formyltetrahydrofolate deformylase [Alphaproteobacteria bacterium]